jgi:hypothetical protein
MAPVVDAALSWKTSLTSVGIATPPPGSNVNANLTRDRYEPIRISVDGMLFSLPATSSHSPSALGPRKVPPTYNDLDYRRLNETGFLKVSGLIPQADTQELSDHMDNVLVGKETAPGFPTIDPSMTDAERLAAFSRIHNAHRVHPLHERFLLHPRILDILEQLMGPDILALQSMSFFKQPGQPGQGWV